MSEVYFVQQGRDGPIKIGLSKSVAGRVQALQTATHEQISVLATVAGNKKAESFFHQKLAASRLNGEWFSPTREVLEIIEAVVRDGAALLPPGCAPRSVDRAVEKQRNTEILLICQTYARALADHPKYDQTVGQAIDRVVSITGLSKRRVLAIWYGETHDVSAYALLTLRKHFSQKYRGLDRAGADDE